MPQKSFPSRTFLKNPSACARVKLHQFPLEENTRSSIHWPKRDYFAPIWTWRLVLDTTGTLHPLEPFWGPLVVLSSKVLCPSQLLLPLRERQNPRGDAKDADSRPRPRCSTESCLKEQLYIPLCGQGLFTSPRLRKAGKISRGFLAYFYSRH